MSEAPERIGPGKIIGAWERDGSRESGECAIDAEYTRSDLVPQWQPIETAPEKGYVIVGNATASGIGWWNKSLCRWEGDIQQPTHWYPRPAPPA